MPTGRELVAAGRTFGLLQVHNDRPSMYEAWDIDAHIGRVVEDLDKADSVRLVTSEPGLAEVETVHSIGESTITTLLRFTAGSAAIDLDLDIDWHEQRRLLKLAFPTRSSPTGRPRRSSSGTSHRPTHTNTTWDVARFETCAHRWVQVGGAGLRRRRRQRLHLRPRHPARPPRRRRARHHRPAVADARADVPRPEDRPGTPPAAGQRGVRCGHRDGDRRGPAAQPAGPRGARRATPSHRSSPRRCRGCSSRP